MYFVYWILSFLHHLILGWHFLFQLDLCQKMAIYPTRSPAGHIMSFSLSFCMDNCCISGSNAYHVGKLVNCNIASRYNWSGCNHGWYCSSIGILFNHALVENTMAKFKYVSLYPLYLLIMFSFLSWKTNISLFVHCGICMASLSLVAEIYILILSKIDFIWHVISC